MPFREVFDPGTVRKREADTVNENGISIGWKGIVAAQLGAHENVGVPAPAVAFNVDGFCSRLHVGAILLSQPTEDRRFKFVQGVAAGGPLRVVSRLLVGVQVIQISVENRVEPDNHVHIAVAVDVGGVLVRPLKEDIKSFRVVWRLRIVEHEFERVICRGKLTGRALVAPGRQLGF
jgi:hypothetical protein